MLLIQGVSTYNVLFRFLRQCGLVGNAHIDTWLPQLHFSQLQIEDFNLSSSKWAVSTEVHLKKVSKVETEHC